MIVSVGGTDLWCTRLGRGVPCLVPLGHGAEPIVRTLPSRLTEEFEFVIVEMRGTTRSSGRASDLSFESVTSDLDGVRRALGFERVVVLGHSIHGVFAAEYARRQPEAVRGVVMVATPAAVPDPNVDSFWETDASPHRKAIDREQRALVPDEIFRQRMTSLDAYLAASSALRARTWYDPTFDDAPLWADTPMDMTVPQRIFGDLAPGWDAHAALVDLRVPTLVALGRYDYRAPYVSWSSITTRAARVEVQLFEQSGHWCHYEEPDEFSNRLSAFVERCD